MTPLKGPSRFVFACWEQNAALISRWKARGCDTVSTNEPVPNTLTMLQYATAVAAQGMFLWTKPSKNPADDLKLPGFEAWELQDEPDSWNNLIGYPDAQKLDVPATVAAQKALVASLRVLSPTTPIYQNLNGWSLCSMGGWPRDNAAFHPIIAADYQSWLGMPDWTSADAYPLAQQNNPAAITIQSDIQDRLALWGVAGQTHFAYVECGFWNEGQKAGRIVTADEFRAQFWLSIIKGAKGIGFFQAPISDVNKPDDMPAALDAEIRTNIALVRKYEAIILNGARTVVQAAGMYTATWTMPDGSRFTASMTLDANLKYPLAINTVPASGTGAATGKSPLPFTLTVPGFVPVMGTLTPQ